MNNSEKIQYLNKIIMSNSQLDYMGPKSLYKYRPFDDYTFDMLEKEYVYLCPAEKLDDITECMTSLDIGRLIEVDANSLKMECVDQIFQFIMPYVSDDNYEIARSKLYSIMNNNGTLKSNAIADLSMDLQTILPEGIDVSLLVNWFRNIPEMLDDPVISGQLKPLIFQAYNSRKETTGICSFAERNDIDYMWKNYAGDYSGYCIEYDMTTYDLYKNIFPVIYDDNRETNIIIQLVGSFIGQMITKMSNGIIQADSSQFLRLFLTKNTIWSYQKEWRLIGLANEKPTAPLIKHIYLGEKVSTVNKILMKDFAIKNRIDII